MPPKRKTTAPSAAPANTSTTNVPPRRRGRPPIMRNNESDANNDDLPQAKRQRTEDVEASQDSDPQSLSGKTHDVDVTSPTRDTSRYHPESLFLSDLGQKAHPETDGEDDDDGEFSTGLRKETSESPAKKTRGTAPRRGKGILPATRSSPRKQAQSSTTSQPQTRLQDEEEAAMKKSSSLRSSSLPPPPATTSTATTTATTSATVQTTSAQLQRVKRKRGRPPKITTRVVDSQSLSDQPAVTAAERTEGTSTIAIPTAETEENISPVDSGGPAADDEQLSPATAIVPSQAVSSQPTLNDISQQEIPRLPQSPEHHHQATASPGLEVPTHSHTSHPTAHVLSHPHSHPASLYPPPPMQYAYYSHHPPHPGAGHYPFTHAPPPPPPPGGPSSGAHPYTSSASQGGLEYSSSFATTVPTSPGGSFTHPYPQHSDQGAAPTHPHHAHNILDPNAPHGNPFPPPGSMGVPSYYTVPPPLPQSDLSAEIDQHERSESELGLASAIAVNGGVKRRVPPPSGTGKAGGRAGRGDHVACHFCRGRKLKCDGRRPTCGHCSLRSLACAYDDFIRRRGPGKKEKNNKRNSKNASNSSGQDENEGQEQNMMLIGPDIAGAGPSQAEILVTLPSQPQPDPLSISSSSIDASIAVPPPQRRRRRNPTNQGSAQSSTSILRFDTAGEGSSSGSNILSGLKPSAVAYAVETNERLPVNVNVGIPNVGMDYYAYHAHLPPGASHDPHQHQQHQHHHHLGLSPYAQQGQAVGYYPQQPHHPTATVAEQESAHHQYGYDGDNDEEHDEDDGDEDADGDADSPNIESQRPHQQAQYDPHHPYAHAPPPHTHAWPEPPGAHTRV